MIMKNPKTECSLLIPLSQDSESLNYQERIFAMEALLIQSGVVFDTGFQMIGPEGLSTREWFLDWSLAGTTPDKIVNWLKENKIDFSYDATISFEDSETRNHRRRKPAGGGTSKIIIATQGDRSNTILVAGSMKAMVDGFNWAYMRSGDFWFYEYDESISFDGVGGAHFEDTPVIVSKHDEEYFVWGDDNGMTIGNNSDFMKYAIEFSEDAGGDVEFSKSLTRIEVVELLKKHFRKWDVYWNFDKLEANQILILDDVRDDYSSGIDITKEMRIRIPDPVFKMSAEEEAQKSGSVPCPKCSGTLSIPYCGDCGDDLPCGCGPDTMLDFRCTKCKDWWKSNHRQHKPKPKATSWWEDAEFYRWDSSGDFFDTVYDGNLILLGREDSGEIHWEMYQGRERDIDLLDFLASEKILHDPDTLEIEDWGYQRSKDNPSIWIDGDETYGTSTISDAYDYAVKHHEPYDETRKGEWDKLQRMKNHRMRQLKPKAPSGLRKCAVCKNDIINVDDSVVLVQFETFQGRSMPERAHYECMNWDSGYPTTLSGEDDPSRWSEDETNHRQHKPKREKENLEAKLLTSIWRHIEWWNDDPNNGSELYPYEAELFDQSVDGKGHRFLIDGPLNSRPDPTEGHEKWLKPLTLDTLLEKRAFCLVWERQRGKPIPYATIGFYIHQSFSESPTPVLHVITGVPMPMMDMIDKDSESIDWSKYDFRQRKIIKGLGLGPEPQVVKRKSILELFEILGLNPENAKGRPADPVPLLDYDGRKDIGWLEYNYGQTELIDGTFTDWRRPRFMKNHRQHKPKTEKEKVCEHENWSSNEMMGGSWERHFSQHNDIICDDCSLEGWVDVMMIGQKPPTSHLEWPDRNHRARKPAKSKTTTSKFGKWHFASEPPHLRKTSSKTMYVEFKWGKEMLLVKIDSQWKDAKGRIHSYAGLQGTARQIKWNVEKAKEFCRLWRKVAPKGGGVWFHIEPGSVMPPLNISCKTSYYSSSAYIDNFSINDKNIDKTFAEFKPTIIGIAFHGDNRPYFDDNYIGFRKWHRDRDKKKKNPGNNKMNDTDWMKYTANPDNEPSWVESRYYVSLKQGDDVSPTHGMPFFEFKDAFADWVDNLKLRSQVDIDGVKLTKKSFVNWEDAPQEIRERWPQFSGIEEFDYDILNIDRQNRVTSDNPQYLADIRDMLDEKVNTRKWKDFLYPQLS